MERTKRKKLAITSGKLLPQLIVFTIPVLLTGVLQLLYNAADLVVVGKYRGDVALAAVGSTGALINLIVNVFIGLSVGANVLVARCVGAKDDEGISRASHTAVLISLIAGTVVGIFGVVTAKTLLRWMDSPDSVIDLSALYVKIYFAGMPFNMLYNFGAAVLRGMGDTKRPLIALSVSGLVNVGLNVVFVKGFDMNVEGVAIATVVSQVLACGAVLAFLMNSKTACRVSLKKLRIHKKELLLMTRIGLPAGIQGSIFSISNVLIQKSVNGFGDVVMAGNSAAANIEGFVYTSMNSVYHAALTFAGQNYGAGEWKRVKSVLYETLAIVTVIGVVLGVSCYLAASPLLGIYTDSKEAIAYGVTRMRYVCFPYFLCGVMDVLVGILRGLGYSFVPMIVSIVGACGFRVLWIYTVFIRWHKLSVLYLSYPVSWVLTAFSDVICLLVVFKTVRRNCLERKADLAAGDHPDETEDELSGDYID